MLIKGTCWLLYPRGIFRDVFAPIKDGRDVRGWIYILWTKAPNTPNESNLTLLWSKTPLPNPKWIAHWGRNRLIQACKCDIVERGYPSRILQSKYKPQNVHSPEYKCSCKRIREGWQSRIFFLLSYIPCELILLFNLFANKHGMDDVNRTCMVVIYIDKFSRWTILGID